MSDTNITKTNDHQAQTGPMGQKYLATGANIALRLWENEQPGEAKPPVARDYETVGYVLAGRATLTVGDQTVTLAPGDSWVVPRGAEHAYTILEAFSAVEATHPPAQSQGRDSSDA